MYFNKKGINAQNQPTMQLKLICFKLTGMDRPNKLSMLVIISTFAMIKPFFMVAAPGSPHIMNWGSTEPSLKDGSLEPQHIEEGLYRASIGSKETFQ